MAIRRYDAQMDTSLSRSHPCLIAVSASGASGISFADEHEAKYVAFGRVIIYRPDEDKGSSMRCCTSIGALIGSFADSEKREKITFT